MIRLMKFQKVILIIAQQLVNFFLQNFTKSEVKLSPQFINHFVNCCNQIEINRKSSMYDGDDDDDDDNRDNRT